MNYSTNEAIYGWILFDYASLNMELNFPNFTPDLTNNHYRLFLQEPNPKIY